jgi:hypothetical protein
MAENGAFESYGRPQLAHCQNHSSHAIVTSSQGQLCATVGVEHVVGREQQSFAVESLLVDTIPNAHLNL